MSPLLILLGLCPVARLVAFHFCTFRTYCRRANVEKRTIVAAALSALLLLVGLGGAFRWRPYPDMDLVGFPFPAVINLFRDWKWVDFVGPPTVICPFLNAFIGSAVFLLPLLLFTLVLWKHAGRSTESVRPHQRTEQLIAPKPTLYSF